jgi:hypothetical protein
MKTFGEFQRITNFMERRHFLEATWNDTIHLGVDDDK